ncbi:unnamed protein product [Phytophthora lilii]|uniref:Unnamed protein product n=1 Tax=Phytophthora lilii TaxID=2077276 RepID=A0A9W6TTH9_9STRA|nr:unnamed protein product [Phytophthora lilii]
MSDSEQDLSDNDADLFGSGSEDGGVEQTIDLPALSLESLYVRSPLVTEDHDVGENASIDQIGDEIGESDAGGFGTSKVDQNATSPREPSILMDELDRGGRRTEDLVSVQVEREVGEVRESSDCVHHENDREVATVNTDSIVLSPCESPRIRGPDNDQQSETNDKQLEHDADHDDLIRAQEDHNDDNDNIQNDQPIDSSNKSGDLIESSTCEGHASLHGEANDLVLDSEPITVQPECVDASDKMCLSKTRQLQPDDERAKPLSFNSVGGNVKTAVYTVESLFPVVYETVPTPSETAKVVPLPATSASVKTPNLEQTRHSRNLQKGVASKLAALQSQLDAAHAELAISTRTFKLQLSMVETDNKKLSQRNARLKDQLAAVSANLHRANAEMAKLKTENELYAARLPQLQAELLQETSQVDETQAQSVQTQLALTQLKARSHVLQTRNSALDAQNTKLTQQLRDCQQQLQRKAGALQQQTERANKLEADVNELKTTRMQEKLDWKNRMANALQRFEHVKTKLEYEFNNKERKDLREAKDRAEKALKKRQAAEITVTKLESQLKQCRYDLTSPVEAVQRHANEVRTLESLLRKSHRTEATLRNDLAACKTKLRSLQDEKKRMARPALSTRRRVEPQIPIELLLPLSDSEEEDNQDQRCCSHCLASSKSIEPASPPCGDCPQLRSQLHQLQQELRRVRSLHTVELRAQASVLDALIQSQGKLQ